MAEITGTRWSVIDYCREEVRRQGHDVTSLDGIERVSWMLDAWSFALEIWQDNQVVLNCGMLVKVGKLVERHKNKNGIRRVGVRVGMHICPPPSELSARLDRLFEHGSELSPLEFYRELLEIHPFVDGNGRTGKVVLNWLNGSLLDPIFPPADFWGEPIQNP